MGFFHRAARPLYIDEFIRPALPEHGTVQQRYSHVQDADEVHERFVDLAINEKKSTGNLPILAYYPANREAFGIYSDSDKAYSFNPFLIYEGIDGPFATFEDFFLWFHKREDLENERLRDSLPRGKIHTKKDKKGNQYLYAKLFDTELEAVRRAIRIFFPAFTEIRIRRDPPRMVLKKDGLELAFDQLSGGEKNFMVLVGDIARRLAIGNANLRNPLNGKGVVLIDEIELHLHPSWQRKAIPLLQKTFPKVQFLITTHSPQVLGEVKNPKNIWLLKRKDASQTIDVFHPKQSFGLDSSEILEELMETSRRNDEISNKLIKIDRYIDNDEFDKAKELISNLRQELNGSIPSLLGAESLIESLEDMRD